MGPARIACALGFCSALAGCLAVGPPIVATDAGQPDAGDPVAEGQAVYEHPLADGRQVYAFACANCHAIDEPAPDGFRRPAHPLGNAANRPSFKNGRITTLLEAVNSCLTDWMGAPAWTESEPRWKVLKAYLEAHAPAGPAPPVTIQIGAIPAVLTGGDSARGQATLNQTCIVCHGLDGRAASSGSLGPPIKGSGIDAHYVAMRVRTSGPSHSMIYTGLTDGTMPFWGVDRLSDDDLRDVIEFLTH